MHGWVLGVTCAVVTAGCGRINFDERTDAGGDAGRDAAVIPACTVAMCPAGYAITTTATATGCYRVVSSPATWLDAELACEADGGHLVVEDSVDEHFSIHMRAATFPEVWVGWTDRRGPDNVFTWVVPDLGGLPQSEPCVFGTTEPDAGDADHCIVQAGTNSCPDYQDISCDVVRPYVCECDGQLADPARY